ncbi:hypothetical protein [Desulfurivibrio alkaliphilus]|uniref:Uncharacterized protein n=1 Tax=Desulfurivibrio alkaliphilus (strain DSM 19089 / UNIQEM U267 / AHT2) TaxID=589865 RepID=D6Z6L2_DESAT|nr:hypothetical protein [Desulfurivibrio alkaliphilus]ADH84971.1 conserved hypothetical protein [Desulfurivibrio alkaliphilus AHT 2]
MQQIATVQAAAGMVLAKDVETGDNRVLCGKGTALTEAMIDRFKRMDITHITVQGHPVVEEGAKTLKEEVMDIEQRFGRVRHIKPLMYLKKRIQERLIAARRPVEPAAGQGDGE